MRPLTAAELAKLDPPRSPWGRKLFGLAVQVQEGRAELGEFHRIGQFDTPHGARDIERRLENHPQLVPDVAEFELSCRRVVDGEGRARRSELWARVVELHVTAP